MIQIDFLAAADGTPLTKRFALENGKLEVDPYPFIKYVTSFRETIASPEELGAILQMHADAQHCMLKGQLRTQLANQSRAGQTDADAETSWLLLDLDFDSGWESIDDFIADLDPNWADVSYVFQHSASAGITSEPGLRGHLHILLDEPASPALLKQWLISRNFDVPGLLERTSLAASGLALKWPLDVTTCQNDKLIYIAPPMLYGIDDPLGADRIVVVTKARSTAPAPKLSSTPAALDNATQVRIATLRAEAGLRPREAKYNTKGALPILTNPDAATVTSSKTARGFTYLNLNGGNSWGYFFPESKPDVVYNFKGEPAFRLRDIDADFYRQYKQRLEALRAERREAQLGGVEPFVFRCPQKDLYYNVLYDRPNDEVILMAPCQSKQRLADFLAQHLTPMPEIIEDWTIVFDPTTTDVIRPQDKWINTFKPTQYIRSAPKLTEVDFIPPIIDKVITSLTGDCRESKLQLINWLAHIFQFRTKTETAWVLHGIQGTGKGLMVSRILRPLLGDEHVVEWTNQSFEDQFNAPLERALVLFLDEFQANACRDPELVMAKLRNYITESKIAIRGMRRETTLAPSYMNIILATNKPDPIHIGDDDRRWNVAPPQGTKLEVTQDEIDEITEELPLFASFLWNVNVNRIMVRKPMKNEAKRRLMLAAETTTNSFFRHLREGNLHWFLDYIQAEMPLHDTIAYQQYLQVMQRWCEQALAEEPSTRVSRDDMRTAYSYLQGKIPTPTAFTRMCNIHNLPLERVRTDEGFPRIAHIVWKFDREHVAQVYREIPDAPSRPKLELVKT